MCVCQTYKQNQASTVSREYDVLSITFLDHCALPFSYYIHLYTDVWSARYDNYSVGTMDDGGSGFECMIDVESGEAG